MTKQKLGMIFTGVAIAGVVVTNVITALRAPKYEQILKECEGKKMKAAMKTYWASFMFGGITIGSMVLAEKANLAEIGVLTGACGVLAAKAKGLEEAIKDRADEKILNDIKHEDVVKYIKLPGPSVEETGRGDVLCLEVYSGRWFRSSEESVRRACGEFKKMFDDGEYLSMNNLYLLLGIVETRFGHQFGFPNNTDYYDESLDIDIAYYEMEKWGEPVLVIDIQTWPMECWQEL